jgi:ubiquinone/menaquinone biosynthesis C-methylase UbiE
MTTEEVCKFWDNRANLGLLAGTNDVKLKQLEMDILKEYVGTEDTVLDLGCGNGVLTFLLAERTSRDVQGVDFSSEMIRCALEERDKRNYSADKINFFVHDLRELDSLPDRLRNYFDVVITERALINLQTWEEQERAIEQIVTLLKPSGRYLMCENSTDSLSRLNKLRKHSGLPEITPPWHNRYLRDQEVSQLECVTLLEQRNFTSLYYLISRVFNALLAKEVETEPSYDSLVNNAAVSLSRFKEFESLDLGQTKLWVFQKRGDKRLL